MYCRLLMTKMKFYNLFCFIFLYFESSTSSDNDKLWILFDHFKHFECSGITNRYTIDKDDISITDKNGKAAYFLECPNEYTIEFRNMKTDKELSNLSGDISVDIQVPVVQSGSIGLQLDYPYQVLPQNRIIGGSVCDNESGVVFNPSENREYCRYCDICQTSKNVEKNLDTTLGSRYLGSEVKDENSFGNICSNINVVGRVYNFKKKISCPGKAELESEANKFIKPGLDAALEKRFKGGRGKLHVFMSLFVSDEAPSSVNKWYANKRGCECCSKDRSGCHANVFSQIVSRFAGDILAGSGNPCPQCNNEYVKTCLNGKLEGIACYRLEFNFRVTNKQSEVDTFKRRIDYDNRVDHGNPWHSVIDAKNGSKFKSINETNNNNTTTF